jgi:enoyl-CoA hydratase/carnithine racemase
MFDEEPPVQVEIRDCALIITLNRPHVLNAQDQAMRDCLVHALDQLDGDDTLRVGVIRGAGRAFSTGADLNELALDSVGTDPDLDRTARYRHFVRLDATRKPLIAVLHGWIVGGGLEVALCCDIRVAAADALFALPEPRNIKGVPGVAVHRLGRIIPLGEALRLLLTNQPIDASRAHAIGLVQEVAIDSAAALEIALQLVAQIAEGDAEAVSAVKQIVRGNLAADVLKSETSRTQLVPRGTP